MHANMSPPAIEMGDDDYEMSDYCDEETEERERKYEKGVKELYENGVHKVPNKYILPPCERPHSMNINMPNPQNIELPIIDLADLLGPKRPHLIHSLAHACQHYGFFQVVNHGIPEDVIRKMMDVSGRFFDLPFEERAKLMRADMKAPVRYGTSFSQTTDSVFCWRDFLKLQCHPLSDFLPHWPLSPLDFRKVACTYAEETQGLFMRLMEGILESLGIVEGKELEEIMKELEDGSHLLVSNYFPPCPEPHLTLGMPPHSDYGFLTLVLHDHVHGLQILFRDNWLTVHPIPNAFVVNVGDHLEIYSNGKYKSVVHRVLVNGEKSRISVASLHSLPFNCMVRPSPKVIDEMNPRRYKDTDFGSFLDYISTRDAKAKDFLHSRKLTN